MRLLSLPFSRTYPRVANPRLFHFAVHSGRKLTRHETPKRFQLLRIENKDPKEPLLPILSDDPDVLLNHPLREFFINASSSDGEDGGYSTDCKADPDNRQLLSRRYAFASGPGRTVVP